MTPVTIDLFLHSDTREYIRQLLREKDEACKNYSEKTKRSQRLAAKLEVAQSDRAVVHAQLSASDSRVACKFFSITQCSPSSSSSCFLTSFS